jgi:hypothetical protein
VSVDDIKSTFTAPREFGTVYYDIQQDPTAGNWMSFAVLDYALFLRVPPAGTYDLDEVTACVGNGRRTADAGADAADFYQQPPCLPAQGHLVVTKNSNVCTPGSGTCMGQTCPPVCAWTFEATLTLSPSPGLAAAVSATLTVRHDETLQAFACERQDY